MTCFSPKDEKKYCPKYLWYACCQDEDLLCQHNPEDIGDPVTPEDGSEEDSGKDKLTSSYFHVEIF